MQNSWTLFVSLWILQGTSNICNITADSRESTHITTGSDQSESIKEYLSQLTSSAVIYNVLGNNSYKVPFIHCHKSLGAETVQIWTLFTHRGWIITSKGTVFVLCFYVLKEYSQMYLITVIQINLTYLMFLYRTLILHQ